MITIWKKSLTFGEEINTSSTSNLNHIFQGQGRIQGDILLYLYRGQEFSVQVGIDLITKDGLNKQIIKLHGDKYLSGDLNLPFCFSVNVPFRPEDELRISAENTSSTYKYHYRVVIPYILESRVSEEKKKGILATLSDIKYLLAGL